MFGGLHGSGLVGLVIWIGSESMSIIPGFSTLFEGRVNTFGEPFCPCCYRFRLGWEIDKVEIRSGGWEEWFA